MKIFVINKKFLTASVLATAAVLCLISVSVAIPTATVPRELPIYCVEREDNAVALTLNCAWNDDDIDDIIALFKQYNCVSTFFVVGDWAEKYPDAVKKLSAAGHEIANHSYNHKMYSKLTRDEMATDMDKCDEIIERLTGKKNIYFRPPSGDYNTEVVRVCNETGRYCIQWSVDSLDWKNMSSEQIVQRVVPKTTTGSIILMHNGTKNTYAALTKILPALAEQKYKFLPVSELIYKNNFKIDHAGRQYME